MTKLIAATALFSIGFGSAARAQSPIQLRSNSDQQLSCERARDFSLNSHFCEMREQTVSPTGRFDIDGVHNGSVSVRGWNRNDVRVRLRVETEARSDARARAIAQQVHTNIHSGRVAIDGPEWQSILNDIFDNERWSVSVEVFAPHRSALRLNTHNGGILVTDIDGAVQVASHNGGIRVERVRGDVRGTAHNGVIRLTDVGGSVEFESHNGTINITRAAGSIRGISHNGGVDVELAGATFSGRRLDVTTHNGSINLAVPRSYSAHVRAETHRGSLNSDFPITVRGRLPRNGEGEREFDLGSGGSPIRLATHNGGIRLRQI
jgi:hypothetical protein